MKYLIIFLSIFTLLNCKIEDGHLRKNDNLLSEEQNITIDVNVNYGLKVGTINGIIPFKTNTKDDQGFFDDSDIEEKTHFDLQIITKKSNIYDLGCRLWKDSDNNIALFWNMKAAIKEDDIFAISETKDIKYNSKNVKMIFDLNNYYIYKFEGSISFLYSKSQNFDIAEDTKTINMNFKIEVYNKEKLFLNHDIGLFPIECGKESNELKCEVNKKDLDIFSNKKNIFLLFYLDTSGNSDYFRFVGDININYQDINKEDVYFKIVDLINPNAEVDSFINFETNATNLDKIKTKVFDLKILEGINSKCIFINHDKLNKLYLSCIIVGAGTYHIGTVQGFQLNDIHYKYNFIFGTQDINKDITITTSISYYVIYSYPKTLDFISTDSLTLYIFTPYANHLNNIRLNENGEDLDCIDGELIKKCTVKKDHFKDRENGYYLIHHKNNEGKYFTNYEDFGINVIIQNPTPTPSKSRKLNQFSFGLLALLCLLI